MSAPAVTSNATRLCRPQKSSLHATSKPLHPSWMLRIVSLICEPQVVARARPVNVGVYRHQRSLSPVSPPKPQLALPSVVA